MLDDGLKDEYLHLQVRFADLYVIVVSLWTLTGDIIANGRSYRSTTCLLKQYGLKY